MKRHKLDIILNFDDSLEHHLKKNYPWVIDYRILSRSLDARGANKGKIPRYHYQLQVVGKGEVFRQEKIAYPQFSPLGLPPLIVGAGPAGLFCALRLLQHGVPSIILERGSRAPERMFKIARYWRQGILDPNDNVCFGEGGAGLFSDGKLLTRIKSPHISYVMQRLADFGAPQEISYLSDPHLGSNKIRGIIGRITEFLLHHGVQILTNARVEELSWDKNGCVSGLEYSDLKNAEKRVRLSSEHVILAFGHSATDFYRHLQHCQVPMESKDFAVGVRMEHPRHLIDHSQLGEFCLSPLLGSARYRLSFHSEASHRGTYSFCMCPGGHVLSSGTEIDGLVTNGMSNVARRSPWSNSALVVSVRAASDFPSKDVLEGLNFQRSLESQAFRYSKKYATGRELPAQRIEDFMQGKKSLVLPKTSCPSGTVCASMDDILPTFVSLHLREALTQFEHQISGLLGPQGLLLAPETRTSSPLRVLRDESTLTSPGRGGLYPCGEGAGYAGGITSAAVDGVKVALALLASTHGYQAN
ncbi:MAG: FAD-dependent monooxygenase [Bdellovibrio sp.]|nr:FAD-dependent monooxygenase [Bdellovibrio sp.]